MPVYEFLCPQCNRIFSFHCFRVDTSKTPKCPKCGASDLSRVPSRFGITAASVGGGDEGSEPELDDPRVEREMMRLASEMENIDESNPRQMASAVRRMAEIAGEPVTPAMEEMIRRMEAGEDPDQVEEDLGDALSEEMGEPGGGSYPAPTHDEGLYPM